MIDFGRVVGFDWDAGNARKSVEKHDVSHFEAEQVFFNEPLLLVEDREHSKDETRYNALGRTDIVRELHVTFKLSEGGTLIRVISARDMHRKERARYDEEA